MLGKVCVCVWRKIGGERCGHWGRRKNFGKASIYFMFLVGWGVELMGGGGVS